MNTLMKEIEKLRKIKGLNEMEFAAAVGMHFTLWSKIKNGHRKPTAKVLKAMVRAFPELQLVVYNYLASNENVEKELQGV